MDAPVVVDKNLWQSGISRDTYALAALSASYADNHNIFSPPCHTLLTINLFLRMSSTHGYPHKLYNSFNIRWPWRNQCVLTVLIVVNNLRNTLASYIFNVFFFLFVATFAIYTKMYVNIFWLCLRLEGGARTHTHLYTHTYNGRLTRMLAWCCASLRKFFTFAFFGC